MSQVITHSAPEPGTLVFERESGTQATWLYVFGELDLATSPQLERALDVSQRDSLLVVLEPRGLTFIDCAGLRVILNAAARARRRAGWLLLVASSPVLERLIGYTGVQDLVTVFDVEPELDPLGTRERRPWSCEPAPAPSGGRLSQTGRLGRLRAIQDDHAEAPPLPPGVITPAWSRPPPGRGHATKRQ